MNGDLGRIYLKVLNEEIIGRDWSGKWFNEFLLI